MTKKNKLIAFQEFLFQKKQAIFFKTQKFKEVIPFENAAEKKIINEIENDIIKIEEHFFAFFYEEIIEEQTPATTFNEKKLTCFLEESERKLK